jgi:hypothetical protein
VQIRKQWRAHEEALQRSLKDTKQSARLEKAALDALVGR